MKDIQWRYLRKSPIASSDEWVTVVSWFPEEPASRNLAPPPGAKRTGEVRKHICDPVFRGEENACEIWVCPGCGRVERVEPDPFDCE